MLKLCIAKFIRRIFLQAIGHTGAAIAFVLQFISLYFHAHNEEENMGRSTRTRILSRFLHDFVLVIAFLGYVNLFRGYWYVLTVYFMPGKILNLIKRKNVSNHYKIMKLSVNYEFQ